MTVSILIADDHSVVREGVRMILAMEPDFDVVGEASDGLETVWWLGQLRPDVLVLDLSMPDVPGLDVIRQVPRRSPDTKVVVLSVHAEEAYAAQALNSGAVAYVVKTAGSLELVEGIRAAVDGGHYLSASLNPTLIKTYQERAAIPDPYDSLTERQRQILHLVAEGRTSGEIAIQLDISRRTVEAHRANILRKLAIDSQAALIRYAVAKEFMLVNLDP